MTALYEFPEKVRHTTVLRYRKSHTRTETRSFLLNEIAKATAVRYRVEALAESEDDALDALSRTEAPLKNEGTVAYTARLRRLLAAIRERVA